MQLRKLFELPFIGDASVEVVGVWVVLGSLVVTVVVEDVDVLVVGTVGLVVVEVVVRG